MAVLSPRINNMIHTARFVIGIDPGRSTGVAVFDRKEKRWELVTLDFWRTYQLITETYGFDATLIVVEDPNVNRPVFDHGVSGRRRERIAQGVGSNKSEARLLADGLERAGFVVIRMAPVRSSKWTRRELEAIVGIAGRSSQHARDACRLAFRYAIS